MSSNRSGKTVAFLGPDGAGKSTVINLVQARLIERGQDFRYFYFAPGFLRRYRARSDGSITTDPHAGRQYGPLLIAAKITLMLLEFRIGVPQVRRQTHLALFDRYIHDLLVDPRRYRMAHLRWWMQRMLAFAPKPDLLVVVSASADVIQMRKQEVPPEETARQVAAYTALARSMPNAVVIENIGTPEEAAEAILVRLESLT